MPCRSIMWLTKWRSSAAYHIQIPLYVGCFSLHESNPAGAGHPPEDSRSILLILVYESPIIGPAARAEVRAANHCGRGFFLAHRTPLECRCSLFYIHATFIFYFTALDSIVLGRIYLKLSQILTLELLLPIGAIPPKCSYFTV